MFAARAWLEAGSTQSAASAAINAMQNTFRMIRFYRVCWKNMRDQLLSVFSLEAQSSSVHS